MFESDIIESPCRRRTTKGFDNRLTIALSLFSSLFILFASFLSAIYLLFFVFFYLENAVQREKKGEREREREKERAYF